MIYLLLFWEFCKVGAFCVGGGYASMPLIQASVVDTFHWLSMSEFVDIFTISQMTPGPIGINAASATICSIAPPKNPTIDDASSAVPRLATSQRTRAL